MNAKPNWRTCVRCGRIIPPNDAYGSTDDGLLCHPDDPTLPDCYSLVTVHGLSSTTAETVNGPSVVASDLGPDQPERS